MGQASRRKWRKRAIAIAKQGAACNYLKTLRKQARLRLAKKLFASR